MTVSHDDLEEFLDDHAGVAGVTELAEFMDASEVTVRHFARSSGVRRIGATFAFDAEHAHDLLDHLESSEDEEDDDLDEDEEDDDLDEDDDDE